MGSYAEVQFFLCVICSTRNVFCLHFTVTFSNNIELTHCAALDVNVKCSISYYCKIEASAAQNLVQSPGLKKLLLFLYKGSQDLH
ncbi:MAG: hypothetical protein ACI8Z9_001162 [Paraglaciecola sp.]|jgi:hypothetical protein